MIVVNSIELKKQQTGLFGECALVGKLSCTPKSRITQNSKAMERGTKPLFGSLGETCTQHTDSNTPVSVPQTRWLPIQSPSSYERDFEKQARWIIYSSLPWAQPQQYYSRRKATVGYRLWSCSRHTSAATRNRITCADFGTKNEQFFVLLVRSRARRQKLYVSSVEFFWPRKAEASSAPRGGDLSKRAACTIDTKLAVRRLRTASRWPASSECLAPT